MYHNNEQSGQTKVRISSAQKAGMFILLSIFLICMGAIIYDKQLVEPGIFAAAATIIMVILLLAMSLFIRELIKKLDAAYNKIELMAITDELTQLFTRKHFYTLFENELIKTIRYRRNLSCILLDIDHFKKIIDKHGQQFSNEILKDTAEVIKDNSRSTDVVARFDSDKFICLLPETGNEAALILSKRLRAIVEGATLFIGEDNETIQITVSVGFTSCKPCLDEGTNISKIINITEKALTVAKEEGRNRVEYLIYE